MYYLGGMKKQTMQQKVLTKHRKDPVTDCWVWTDALNTNGYGVVWDPAKQKQCKAHRVAYEELVGPIPDELPIDHLCRNRACVNPAHLQPVTLGENVRRGVSPPAQRARQTHCKNGHELSGDNLRVDPKTGYRQCSICVRERAKNWKKNNPEAYASLRKRSDKNRSEKIKEYLRAYYLKNRDKAIQYARDKRKSAKG